MPTIKIGDQICEFEGQKSILQVAQENNIEIPSYCYHEGLSVTASCRICLAEVAQPDRDGNLATIPKLVPTCQHPAVDGAEVYTDSAKTVANQKAVMEYLLINHPLDCPVCDQAGECSLQDYSYSYGRAASRFDEDKIKQPKKDIGPNVLLYSDRCIMCTRCVRFTREVSETGELGVVGRGRFEEIDIFPGQPLDNELSGNVVDLCPVGALLDKDFQFSQRVWFMTSTPAIDPITASGDNLWLDHNEGVVYRVKPRTNKDVNGWWITDEVRYGWKFVHSENRLTSARITDGPKQVDADWPTAIEAAARGLNDATAAGGHLAVLVSPMLTSEDAYLLAKLVKTIDPKAILAVGPIPYHGDDKEFAGGFKMYAEKAPNARGVKRALELVAKKNEEVYSYQEALTKLPEAQAIILTGNYPSDWVTDELKAAVDGKFTVLLDTLPNTLTDNADVLLPAATFAEKAGSFENANNRIQAFDQAIQPIEFARPEAQIALDLLAELGKELPSRFDAAATRQQMGGAFVKEIHLPAAADTPQPDMAYATL